MKFISILRLFIFGDSDFQPDIQIYFLPLLRPGEKIIWEGKSGRYLYLSRGGPAVLLIVFSIIMWKMIMNIINYSYHFDTIVQSSIIFLLMCYSFLVLLRPLFTYYVVTDQRVMQFRRLFSTVCTSIELHNIQTCMRLTPHGIKGLTELWDDYNFLVISSRIESRDRLATIYKDGLIDFTRIQDPPEIVIAFSEPESMNIVAELIFSLNNASIIAKKTMPLQHEIDTISNSYRTKATIPIESYINPDERKLLVLQPSNFKFVTYVDILSIYILMVNIEQLINYIHGLPNIDILYLILIDIALLFVIIDRYILQYIRRKKTIYIVTDKNIIIIFNGYRKRIIRIPLSTITLLSYTYIFPSIGTIKFRAIPGDDLILTYFGFTFWHTMLNQGLNMSYALYDIPDVKLVANIINIAMKLMEGTDLGQDRDSLCIT